MASTWESMLEVQPSLGQCNVILQQHLQDDSGCESERAGLLDHSSWSVSLCAEDGLLHISLSPPEGSTGFESVLLSIIVGVDVQIPADCLRRYTDHLCLKLRVPSGSPWLQQLVRVHRGAAEDEFQDVSCRFCSQTLLEVAQKSAFVLPSLSLDVCSELTSCECCAGKDIPQKKVEMPQIQAKPGSVYISPATLLVCAADLCPSVVLPGEDALVRCQCGFVVGEMQFNDPGEQGSSRQWQTRRLTPVGGRVPRSMKTLSIKCLCTNSLRIGRGQESFSLYKHRISMLKQSVGDTSIGNALAPFTEEAAVGMQLLSLRSQEGHSRFVLLPGKPEETFGGPSGDGTAPFEDLLELRVLAAEVFIIGPSEPTLNVPAVDVPVQRAAKVCFRRRPCSAVSQSGCVVVTPYMEFEAVGNALRRWCAALPSSLRCAPPFGKDDGGGAWNISYLPLPPQDAGIESA